ncbi:MULTISPECIES: fimbrial protein [Stenotrophomonas]|uniref:fimbrial protein n=1 Tax=Stenotrophomonas TaxID=40323 RepID=UPI000DA9B21C|nr:MULTISPECIES: fimbrial protein [Stenotrophomonas]AYA90886.1 hypothetical protein PEM_09050 [Stenotrophomonas sp. Pemsol]MCU1006430.1 fimbrial protein [Stenotrophomonas maltophilia]PZS97143.1 hypothetical protein A7X90_06205 [Stenotrophomonas maltophilia]PZT14255.1 hypothetical protein A7X86_16760 [Stenotrophomonas maltophilia]PZT40136.1 hypothetical protein A7X99_09465 [Stenotrophomonas maltophilia]
MNKLALALSAALSLGAVASASAADATINFKGDIKALPCAISVGAGGTSVAMPTITPDQITSGASRNVDFDLKMGTDAGKCPANTYTLAFKDSALTDGMLSNSATTGAAKNVALTIVKDGSELDLSTDVINHTLAAEGVVTIPLQARLDRAGVGTVEAGTYSGDLLINVTY